MAHDKKIEIACSGTIHRLTARIPEPQREFGLWIIGGSAAGRSAPRGDRPPAERFFEFHSISHLLAGRGRFIADGRERELLPGDAVLIAPGKHHWYGSAPDAPYVEDSLCFCGRIPDALFKAGLLHNGVIRLGRTRRLLPILRRLQEPGTANWLDCNLMLLQLLRDKCCGAADPETSPLEPLLKAIKDSPNDHWWRVDEMAELCGVSPSQLRRIFLRHTGMRPKAYVEQFKLRRAAEILLSGDDRVSDVAARFGYMDYCHFSRRFKLLFGASPDHSRKSFGRR